MEKIEKMYAELSTWTVLEIADLVKRLEDGWGVSAAAPAMAMPAGSTPPKPLLAMTFPSPAFTPPKMLSLAVLAALIRMPLRELPPTTVCVSSVPMKLP